MLRPHLYLYAHSNELEELGVISLSGVGVKVDYDPQMEALFAVSYLLFSLACTPLIANLNP